MKRCVATVVLAVAFAGSAAPAAEKKMTMVQLESRVEIAAAPAQVWSHLTRGADLAACWPVWKAPENAKRTLASAGDRLEFTDEWGNRGLSVVTFVAKEKELRFADEPNDGSYVCQSRLVLEPAGTNRTLLRWIESYSDESPPEDQAATANKVTAGMEKTLADFAALAAKP